MISDIREQIKTALRGIGIENAELTMPPNPEMGDLALPCFAYAKTAGKRPADVAIEIAEKLNDLYQKEDVRESSLVREVKAFGPYVNFFFDESELAQFVMTGIEEAGDTYGTHKIGTGKQVLIEFGCPNIMKVFHLGHLKNLITGESVVRVFENAGYDVVRTNYQGDVGMHIAKTLWGIDHMKEAFEAVTKKTLGEQVAFLGKAYAYGATQFEENDDVKGEIGKYNELIYEKDPTIQEIYQTGRQWSLDYFETIYTKLASHYDKYYFESEMYERGVEIVEEGKKNGIFKESDGAIIFPGSEYDLHDRVFINSKGYPTYEGKELALAEKHFTDFDPYQVIHVVGKEQTEYFKVIFTALEQIKPETKGREYHLIGGYLQLKGEQKMSSRTGNVISGNELIDAVGETLRASLVDRDDSHMPRESDMETITAAALKYAMLKADVSQDVAFDMEESVSTSGESGPYLLYIVARISSILKKVQEGKEQTSSKLQVFTSIAAQEKALLLLLAQYPEVTQQAVHEYDPSHIAKYTFDLAQSFNAFYAACPVLDAEEEVRAFRISLITSVKEVMTRGLHLLGIETVATM